jgi:hypothetical protein
MNDKERRVREQRLSEAIRKGLTGLEGKFGTILRYLGKPIIGHGGEWVTTSEALNVYDYLEEEKTDELEEMDEEQTVIDCGYVFDGLASGIHLEIIYKLHEKELKVFWEGNLVYAEVASELECYSPSHTWESKVDYLFNVAKKREKKEYHATIEENKIEAKRQKFSLLDHLRKRWGI